MSSELCTPSIRASASSSTVLCPVSSRPCSPNKAPKPVLSPIMCLTKNCLKFSVAPTCSVLVPFYLKPVEFAALAFSDGNNTSSCGIDSQKRWEARPAHDWIRGGLTSSSTWLFYETSLVFLFHWCLAALLSVSV
jgi:hypothetical protein